MRADPLNAAPTAKPGKESAMDQHARFKAKYPDCLLLFRIGDFYETFHDDAKAISTALGLTLTKRKDGIPLAGVPHHQLENYLRRLVDQGFRVAVAEQMQDPKDAKGVVERDVTRIVTPGTVVDEALLDPERISTLASIAFDPTNPDRAGLAIIESATGSFDVFEGSIEQCRDELARSRPSELIFACADIDQRAPEVVERIAAGLPLSLTPCPVWPFRDEEARRCLLEQLGVITLEAFGLESPTPARSAAGAAVRYLLETSPSQNSSGRLAHLHPPKRGDAAGVLDAVSLRALEVERTLRDDSVNGSLLGVFLRSGRDGAKSGAQGAGGSLCRTPMGKRLLRDWLCRPLSQSAAILERQGRVAVLVEDHRLADELCEAFDAVRDVARIAGRLALGRATPRDLVSLSQSVRAAETLSELLSTTPAFTSLRATLAESLEALQPLATDIAAACTDDPPGHLRAGGLFRDGCDNQLDEARLLQRDAGAWLVEYQSRLSKQNEL
jgi:DNA mismatch repair protein MutS